MLDKSIDVAFAFGPFKLIPGQHVLLRDNRPVKLGGRALDILHLLVMRAGQEVSKNALIESAWPNVFVDEHNLKVHISSLRRALEDTLPQATYIATVVGRGYQFVGRVQTESIEVEGFSVDEQPIVSSLPAPSTLVGRQRDVEGVARALNFTNLVTLVGPGGVGKTSLAIAVAHTIHDEFPDGVRFVDFSATDHPSLVPHLVATALGVRGDPADLSRPWWNTCGTGASCSSWTIASIYSMPSRRLLHGLSRRRSAVVCWRPVESHLESLARTCNASSLSRFPRARKCEA